MINFNKLVEAINDATNIANSTLLQSQNDLMSTYFESSDNNNDGTLKTGNNSSLQAKMVAINYPVKSEDNSIKNVVVEVPLITLVPISTTRIEELKFTTNLEIALNENDTLLASFSNEDDSDVGLFSKKKKTSLAKIEITLKPNESPEGLKSIIEGYEKVLRTQIPG